MTGATMRPEDDPGWASYARTLLVFPGPPALEVDLSRPPTPGLAETFASMGLDRPFGMVTPENPYGRPSSRAENTIRFKRFLDDLDFLGATYLRVDGHSPDRQHVEHGVAVLWPQDEVIALARWYEQSSIYWWDGTAFWVIGALTEAAPWRMGTGA